MPVVRPVVDQQEQARRRQALAQAVEQDLGLRIQPVQILADQQEGLHLALAQQHSLERGERALAALRGIKLQKRAVRRQGVEQRQERRNRVVEGRRASAPAPVTLACMVRASSRILHVAIAPQQVENREVGRGLAVGHRGTVEHQPALGVGGWTNSSTSRDLPTPASPTTATT